MADSDPISLTKAQLRHETDVVRNAARRLGMNWAIWDHVGAIMAANGIDRIELADWLANCQVSDVERIFGVNRYRVEGIVPDSGLVGATVMIHSDVGMVEVVAIDVEV